MPGNIWELCWGDQLEMGSSTSTTPPPRHWRAKAKAARVIGRRVRRRINLEAKEWWLEEVVCDGLGPAIDYLLPLCMKERVDQLVKMETPCLV